MSNTHRSVGLLCAAVALLALSAAPALAQGQCKGKPPTDPPNAGSVSLELALSTTRDVLIRQGFEVVRVEAEGQTTSRGSCPWITRLASLKTRRGP